MDLQDRTNTAEATSKQVQVRLEKRRRILDGGQEAYPVEVVRTHSFTEIRAQYGHLAADASTGDRVHITGRVTYVRDAGNLCFATLRDGDAAELQVMFSQSHVGAQLLGSWKQLVDLGDIVGIAGEVIVSRTGELSVLADDWRMAAKSIRPLPGVHQRMSEEARVRQRYVDLLVRPGAREAVQLRATVVASLRAAFADRRYIEVETPMLQVQPGGAAARPFITHSNALNIDLYLRIAPELFLKRCVVGGIERVFEINRNFRNEGTDSSHSPEFAMLEAYEAYSDYRGMAMLTRELVQHAAQAAFGSHRVRHADGTELDLGGQWREVGFHEALSRALDDEISVETPVETLRTHAMKHDVVIDTTRRKQIGAAAVAEKLFDALVAPTLVSPTFVMDYPEESSPLTRSHRSRPGLAERWDLYVRGFELATGYSELVDPVIQRERLSAQALLNADGDLEAMRLDEDFLSALEVGMPPTGGIGLGIDRLLMALSGLNIRDTILFPLVRPSA